MDDRIRRFVTRDKIIFMTVVNGVRHTAEIKKDLVKKGDVDNLRLLRSLHATAMEELSDLILDAIYQNKDK